MKNCKSKPNFNMLSPNFSQSPFSKNLAKMSSPGSPTLNEVVENIMEDVLRERAKQAANQKTTPVEEIREERVFFTENGTKAFRKTLIKKGFIEERGFRKPVLLFKEEVERRGWELLCHHLEPGRRAMVKEFYANLGERRDLTCYVKGRWVPFGERAISQLIGLKEGGDFSLSLRGFRRTLISRKSLESSLVAKGNRKERRPSPMPS